MPNLSDILFGLRNLLLVCLCLLLVNAVFASLFGVAGLPYPAEVVTNLSLWVGVVVGSFATTRYSARIDRTSLFGGIVGGGFGALVAVVMGLFGLFGALSSQSLLGLLLLVVFYAVLGLLGATAGGLAPRSRKGYYVAAAQRTSYIRPQRGQ